MWLPLAEYSLKHKVSISTLRRKIKAEDIQYRLDEGKYLILDEDTQPEMTEQQTHRPSLKSDSVVNTHLVVDKKESSPVEKNEAPGESVITAANRLLTDLKKAYTQVLQEKENQILGLRGEISDLRTLVRVLESENQRLNVKHTQGYEVEDRLEWS